VRTVLVVVILGGLLGAGFGFWHRLQASSTQLSARPEVESLLTTMPSKSVAAILAHTDPAVAAELLLKMPRQHAVAILGYMSPAAAAKLITLMNQEGR
jgi:flagellar motility protein MotE (MotC chaperone)